MRVFLDANILFSAAKSAGAIRELLARLQRAGHELVVDAYVVAEARRNLETKGVDSLAVFESILDRIEVAPFRLQPLRSSSTDQLPEKDRPVLSAAIRLRCEALVTGDNRHFGPLHGVDIEGVTVHSPRSLAETLGL